MKETSPSITTVLTEAIGITRPVPTVAALVIFLVIVPQALIPGWDEKKPFVLLVATSAVVMVFLVSLVVVWILHKLGGTATKATFDASFKKTGGTVRIKAPGLVGTFLAIVACAIAAIYLLFTVTR